MIENPQPLSEECLDEREIARRQFGRLVVEENIKRAKKEHSPWTEEILRNTTLPLVEAGKFEVKEIEEGKFYFETPGYSTTFYVQTKALQNRSSHAHKLLRKPAKKANQ